MEPLANQITAAITLMRQTCSTSNLAEPLECLTRIHDMNQLILSIVERLYPAGGQYQQIWPYHTISFLEEAKRFVRLSTRDLNAVRSQPDNPELIADYLSTSLATLNRLATISEELNIWNRNDIEFTTEYLENYRDRFLEAYGLSR